MRPLALSPSRSAQESAPDDSKGRWSVRGAAPSVKRPARCVRDFASRRLTLRSGRSTSCRPLRHFMK
eukprot:1014891-Alexandrium_andersonii.AAC.1